MVHKYAVGHGESKLKENFVTVMECCGALYVCTYHAVHVINGSGFFFFIKLAIIFIKGILSVKAKTFYPMHECLVSWSAEHSSSCAK